MDFLSLMDVMDTVECILKEIENQFKAYKMVGNGAGLIQEAEWEVL